MGKGVAKEFSKRFPKLLPEYKEKCTSKELRIGKNYVYLIPNHNGTKFIVNFPTKKHWRNDSKIEYISDGLDDLIEVIKNHEIKSIAMPALGCGNGNLEWNVVKPIIVNKLSLLNDVEIIIYEPAKKENIEPTNKENIEKKSIKKVTKPRLTKDRKILLLLMDIYNSTIGNEKITYREINALSYLMHNNNTKVQFDLKSYGPYSPSINTIIASLAKYYIKPLEKQPNSYATPIEIVSLDFPQKSSILKDKEFIYYRDFIKGFELKENLIVLTITLWMFKLKNVYGEELETLVSEWLEKNNDSYSIDVVKKAVLRIEKIFKRVEVLKLDL